MVAPAILGIHRQRRAWRDDSAANVPNLLTKHLHPPHLPPNENGLPEGKPLFYLVAGARFELATFGL
jgi:hypothetical protein